MPNQNFDLRRRLAAEAGGTAFLLVTVVGSGIMAEQLAGGNVAIALLGNTIPTGAILVVLITALGPVSGAHFNPAVTVAFWIRSEIAASTALAYILLQIVGGLLGVLAAHAMFEEQIWQWSTRARTGPAQWLAEVVATFGLVATIFAAIRWRPESVAWMVGLANAAVHRPQKYSMPWCQGQVGDSHHVVQSYLQDLIPPESRTPLLRGL